MPIRQIWDKRTPRRDLTNIIDRTATELSFSVRNSLRRIDSPDPNIGLLGFTIEQLGLTYTVRYKDDDNKENYRFEVTVPDGQPYLRRMKDMNIAEKAHALMLVSQSLTASRRQDIAKHLAELEYACFREDSGTVHNVQTGAKTKVRGAKPLVHYGLTFPPDDDYQTAPECDIKAIEWLSHRRYHLIDCSEVWPSMITASEDNPAVNRMYMNAEEAKAAIDYIEIQAKATGGSFAQHLDESGLLHRLRLVAQHSSVFRRPAGP